MKKYLIVPAVLIVFFLSLAHATIVNFDNLSPAIAYSGGGSYENGSNLTPVSTSTGSWGQTINHNQFTSGGAAFSNNYTPSYSSWDGWSYSNTTDTTTPGLNNQFSASTGGAYSGSNYGVFFEAFGTVTPTISFGGPVNLVDAYINNTTYAYKAVKEGNDGNNPPFVKGPFAAGDYFKITVLGFGAGGQQTGFLDFYLADYRNADSSNWYTLNDWTRFDLSGLGTIYGLGFDLSSSDTGQYGMNTPAYFAMDNLQYNAVPIPGAVWLLGSGVVALAALKRRKIA